MQPWPAAHRPTHPTDRPDLPTRSSGQRGVLPHARPNVIKARGNQPAAVAGHRRRHPAHHGPVGAEHRRTGTRRRPWVGSPILTSVAAVVVNALPFISAFHPAPGPRRRDRSGDQLATPAKIGIYTVGRRVRVPRASGAENRANLVLVSRDTTDGTTRPRLHLQQHLLTELIGRVGFVEGRSDGAGRQDPTAVFGGRGSVQVTEGTSYADHHVGLVRGGRQSAP
jgi:hypothetical protein